MRKLMLASPAIAALATYAATHASQLMDVVAFILPPGYGKR